MTWFVYMLRCADGTLYTGATNNVDRRLAAHQRGRGGRYTRSRLPVTLVYREIQPDKSAALRREIAVKKLTRSQKLALIAEKEKRIMQEMRRKDRQMSEEFAWGIVDQCEYAFMAMSDEGQPYGAALTIAREGRSVYIHSALEGRKVRCMRNSPQVCLVCVGETSVPEGTFTTKYQSAVAFGAACEVTDEAEKIKALRLLCQRHAPGNMEKFDKAVAKSLAVTGIWRIDVEEITGKAR